MKIRPIIFSTDMVKAILDGRKTQTRRVVKLRPHHIIKPQQHYYAAQYSLIHNEIKCPYGQVGDRLSVKEEKMSTIGGFRKHQVAFDTNITLEITDVRVERLQEIKEKDIIKEGVYINRYKPTLGFIKLWNSIHKKEHRWEDNPWVWVITFKVLT